MKRTAQRYQLGSSCLQLLVGAALVTAALCSSEGLEYCCGKISSDPICNDTCIQTLSGLSQTSAVLTPTQIQVLSSACSPSYTTFWSCVDESISSVNATSQPTTDPTPQLPGYYYCCNEAGSESCRLSCQQYLASSTAWIAHISDLSANCGAPPSDPMWSCLLDYQPPENETTLMPGEIPPQPRYADWARVQCCYKAVADECKSSCLELYSGLVSSSSWSTFQLDCIHRPSENVMSTCLLDVSSPCKLGCSGLQFCDSFNNRPTMSFRHCTTSADRMAKNSYYGWIQSGVIPHPLITLFVDHVDHCLARMWKTVACITHVQPCHSTTHATQICSHSCGVSVPKYFLPKDDCLRLLSTCSESEVTPQAVCDIIAPANTQDYCISLDQLLEPSEYGISDIERVTNPCSPNPCAEGYFCAINHRCQGNTQSCTPYSCQPGCVVGDRPSFVVSEGGGVRVSLVTDLDKRCYGYFNCSSDNTAGLSGSNSGRDVVPALGGTEVWSGYQPVYQHCEEEEECVMNNVTHMHQTTFKDSCNFCTCYHGRVACTNRSCSVDDQPKYQSCGCSMNYRPVCSYDGKTIPNPCIASCLGYSTDQYRHGDCGSVDPCGGSSTQSICGSGARCLPHRHVCISPGQSMDSECKQYTCVSLDGCKNSEPVCDSNSVQHTSLCSFLRTQGEIDYYGYCKDECSQDIVEHVCGVNGETYNSPCHAENSYVAVDYTGTCMDVPGSNKNQTDVLGNCANVVCPQLPPDCAGVLSHDSCCPKCGGHITILFDEDVLQRNIFAMGKDYLSSIDILRKLSYHISSLQCDLFGHVTHDGSLSTWVIPTDQYPDNLMIKACNAEAVKLATFINNHTPMLASDPILSHLVAAEVVTTGFLSSPQTTPPGNNGATTVGDFGGAECVLPSISVLALTLILSSLF